MLGRREPREHWSESDDFNRVARGLNWTAARWVVFWVLLLAALVGGGFWLKVALAPVKGAADVHVEVNSAKNRIAGQELSQQMYNNILKYDRNLDQALRDKTEHPGDDFYATNYSGVVKICNDAVADYNAAAAKIRTAPWWSPELPVEIDNSNPRTDCQPNIAVETPK